MIKWVIAVVLVLAVLSVTGCCCCSSGYDGYYSTVGQEETGTSCSCDTPYDCPSAACGGACACPK
jgi:hypothetical protein